MQNQYGSGTKSICSFSSDGDSLINDPLEIGIYNILYGDDYKRRYKLCIKIKNRRLGDSANLLSYWPLGEI
jgi:hypothetical protein